MWKRSIAVCAVLILVLSLTGNLVEGGVVEISQLNNPSDLDLSGDIVYAVNFGNNGNPDVGGFFFSQDQDYPSLTHNASEGPATWWGPYPGTDDAGLNQLLNGLAYRYPPATVSIDGEGLSIGMQYLLQLVAYEPETHGDRILDIFVENEEIITGFNALDHQGGVVGEGGVVIKYTFTATDPILNIRIVPYDNAPGISGLILTLQTCQYTLAGDLNDDCRVNFFDFALMADNWLTDCYQTPDDPGCVPK